MLVVECEQKMPYPKVLEVRITSFDGQKYLEVQGNGFAFHDLVFDSRKGDVVTFRSHSMPDRKISVVSIQIEELLKELIC
jgi:hypothetical protein